MRPRPLLICCEGKTEGLYFEAVRHGLHITAPVRILQRQGQHLTLIDYCCGQRRSWSEELKGVSEEEIVAWAVCDRDKMQVSYAELQRYANEQNVKLALSVPQFETYLVQHFALRNTKKKGADLERELSELIGSPYRKGNLDWLEQKIDEDPNVLEFAVRNSKQFSHSTKIPFLTVHELTAELLTMAR